MGTLEEDLRALAQLVPKLPDAAKEAVQAATALVAAAAPLRDEIKAVADATDEATTVTSSLGQAFAKHANELEQHLRSVVEEARQDWEKARQGVAAAAEPAFEADSALDRAKDAMVDTLDSADDGIDPTLQAEAATERLRDTGEKAGDEIEREAKDLDEAMTAYEELMWDRVPRLNDASEGLMRRIEELENRLEEQAGTLIATMAAKAAEHDEALRASLAGLLAALEEERGVTTQHLADEVAKPLAEAADAARQALAELSSGAQERDKRLVEARTQFVQAFMDLEGAARPIPGTIQQIHDAYQQIDGL